MHNSIIALFIIYKSVNHGQDDRSFVKQLEFEFHSANYFAMLEAVQILNNVFGHLTKV